MIRKSTVLSLLILIPSFCFATWQLAGNPTETPGKQSLKFNQAVPAQLNENPRYTVYLHKGLLFDNIYPYASKHYWRLNWMVPRDIAINVNTKITGSSFTEVMQTLFSFYPNLKVSFNLKTQTMTVRSSYASPSISSKNIGK